MRDTDVAPKCVAFREARKAYDAVGSKRQWRISVARRGRVLDAADYFKIAGRNFEVEMEYSASPKY